jgi:hypothetical protein
VPKPLNRLMICRKPVWIGLIDQSLRGYKST